MKKNLLLAGFIAAIHVAFAQERYLSEVFTNVNVTYDVIYGQNMSVLTGTPTLQNLRMDIYQPAGDTLTARPVILYLHTGSFLPKGINGTPTGDLRDSSVAEMCMQFARRGYFVVAPDYRLGWNPAATDQVVRTSTLLNAAFRGLQDAKVCVRYLYKSVIDSSNKWKIDTNKIAVGGQGSGGY